MSPTSALGSLLDPIQAVQPDLRKQVQWLSFSSFFAMRSTDHIYLSSNL